MPQPAEQLVGRAAELELLDRELAELERTGSRAIELAGEPGIGKTRLLAELGDRADRAGLLVLSGSASELERELPFWIFVDALDDYVHALEPRRLALLDDEVRAELGQILPSLEAGAGGAPMRPEPHRTQRAFRQLLDALAIDKPLVLLLDDLHWADSASIELLGALLRRPPDRPLLIAVTLRPRQAPERLAGALARADRNGALTRIELAALTRAESGALLGASVSASDAAALHERSGGNPFYLQQLARSPRLAAVGSDGAGVALAGVELPRAVADALTGELALLPDGARRLLQGAAVAGDPFESELASVAAELHDAAALDALDELLRRDLVRDTLVPRRFRFRHPLVRRVVYDAAPGGWKLGAHERCAALLAERRAPAVERANHVERSARHGDGAAVAVLRDAGDASAGRAPANGAALYGAALRLLGPQAPERAALLVAAGRAHSAAGQLPEAHAAMLETLALIPADDVPARIEQLAVCAGIENWLGLYDQANAHLTAALAELADETSHAAVALMMQLATDRIFAADYDSALQWAQRCLEAVRPHGDRALTASAALLVAFAGVAKGSTAEAASACAEAAAIVDEIDDGALARTLFAASPLAIAELALDRAEAAARHAERGLSAARSSGQDRMLPLLYWVATTRRARGRLEEAAELFDAAIEIGHVSGISQGLGVNMLGRSLTATAAGDTEAALAFAEEGAALLSSETSFAGAVSGLARAGALLSTGDPAHAVEALLTASGGDELQRLPAFWRAEGFELLTRCWLALGRREEAARAAVAAEAFVDALAVRGARMHAERAAAAVALDRGDAGAAADRALAAAAAADDAGAPVEAALARMLAARALTAAGERDRAAAELTQAAEAFDRCAAPRRRAAAERELRRLGRRGVQRRSRAGKSDGGGLEALTERELQIARMIVDRRTNREIAGELFLSLKTVETHVRNLFHKLGVSSRVEVARAVERADREARAPAG